MERKLSEPTFFDAALADTRGRRTTAFLDRCEKLIPWDELVAVIKPAFPSHAGPGRPFWPPLVMLKCLLLQKWFGLSDPQAEEALQDRASFRCFLGLYGQEPAPDETTFVKVRNRLGHAGVLDLLFDKVVAVLSAQGLVLKEGIIVDATIVAAPMGQRKVDADGVATHTRDRCASYTKNHGALRHGYKAHIATDTRGMIVGYVFDTARVHDSKHIDQLTKSETRAIYADSAYRSRARANEHAQRGVRSMITHKRVRGQAELAPEQLRHNRECSKIRGFVEHARAWMVKMGYTRVRYRGLRRNGADFALMAIAYNLKRSFHLLGMPLTPARA